MASDVNTRLGRGVGSRLQVQQADLPDGWRVERASAKCCVWYDEKGRRYRTSTEVVNALRKRNLSETESETASEYNPSPLKKGCDRYVEKLKSLSNFKQYTFGLDQLSRSYFPAHCT